VAPEVAARCAERMVPPVKEALAELADRYAAVDEATPLDELGDLDTQLWDALVEGSDNIAFRLSYNALKGEAAGVDQVVIQLLSEEIRAIDLRSRLLDRTMAGDVDAARATAAELIALGTTAMTRAMAGASPTRSKAREGRAR
jgi:DNA-binding FadR family transcriptional regulator